jgi:hypothetical protein
MGFFKSLVSTPKIIDTLISGGDALVFTGEEKSEWMLKAYEATAPQNLARRLIGLVIAGVWAFASAVAVINSVAIMWFRPDVNQAPLVQIYMSICAVNGVVVGFYFWKRMQAKTKAKD